MNLKGYCPDRILLYIINNFRNNDFEFTPFRLQKQPALLSNHLTIFLSPTKVTFFLNYHFKLICFTADPFLRGRISFRGKADPIPHATQWVSARRVKKST